MSWSPDPGALGDAARRFIEEVRERDLDASYDEYR